MYHLHSTDIPVVAMTTRAIVLDLDQTLVATQDEMADYHRLGIGTNPNLLNLRSRVYHIVLENLNQPGAGTKSELWGVIRPHTREFLMFCFSYFKIVAVWSAGQRPYVEAIVNVLFQDLPQPHVVFTYDDVVTGPGGYIEKPLSRMIESNPVLRQHMSLERTQALDDNSTTFAQNRRNGVLIPAYEPALNIDAMSRDDHALLQFKYWLLQPRIKSSLNVTTLDTNTIFTTSLEKYKQELSGQSGYKFTDGRILAHQPSNFIPQPSNFIPQTVTN